MEWTKVLFYLFLATSRTLCVKTEHSNQEIAKQENINSSENEKLQINATKRSDESLEESPSETIRFKKAFILNQSEESSSSDNRTKTRVRNEDNTDPKSVKDLKNEENRYFPVMIFTETSKPRSETHWKVISPEVPPYRGQNVFRNPLPIQESANNKPKMPTMHINYPPPENLEDRHIDDSRSREYPGSFESQDSRYSDSEHPPSHGSRYSDSEHPPSQGHGIHTETTHDYGRFLDVGYRSKIEKDAEEIIRSKKAHNSTRGDRPPPSNEEKRQNAPEQYHPHQQSGNRPGQFHQYQQPGHSAFYHLGNFQTSNPYQSTDGYYNKNGERYRYTSQEQPNTENYPAQQHTYAPRKPESVTDYYIPKKPVSSTETYGPQFSHSRKKHPSFHPGPPNAPRQYEHSTEQYTPTHLQREQPPYVRTTPQSPGQYITSTEQLPPHYHREEKEYHTSFNSGYTQPPDHASPQYHSAEKSLPISYNSGHTQTPEHVSPHYNSGEKNLPISYYSDHIQPPDHTSSQYHSGEKNIPISYNSGHTQTPEHVSLQYQSGEKNIPISYNSGHDRSPEHVSHQYHSGEKNFPVLYTAGYGQYEDPTIPPTKQFQEPYSEKPREPTLPPTDTEHLHKNPVPHSNSPYTKTEEEIHQERSYYKAYRSLIDLYKSYGFKPVNMDEMPEFFPPRYAFGNPFSEKIPISAPISGAISTEQYIPNHKVPEYIKNVDTSAPSQHNYDNFRAPYEGTWHNSNGANHQEEAPYKPDSNQNSIPLKLQNTYYHEQIPYDSNRSPVVSTEHHDTSEVSKPGVFNTQVESPKGTFYQDEFPTKSSSPLRPIEDDSRDVERKPIRIKDYNSETFYGNPSQENEANSAERGFSSPSRDIPPHSIIRKNPPYLPNSNLEEHGSTEYNERPRKYPKNIPSDVSSEEGVSNFRPPNVADNSKGNKQSDPSYDDGTYNPSKRVKSTSPGYKIYQWMSRPDNSPKVPRDTQKDGTLDEQEYRSNKSKRPGHSSDKMLQDEEAAYEQKDKKSAQNTNSDSRTKKHGKRSSQKRPKKHKPSRRSPNGDRLKAEGSTHHWGMERHKDTGGFFQYVNVPGAKAFEFGYRMGGPDQLREKHHRTQGIQSKIKVNWEDKNGDTGDHYWEFNHDSREDDTEEKKPKAEKSYE